MQNPHIHRALRRADRAAEMLSRHGVTIRSITLEFSAPIIEITSPTEALVQASTVVVRKAAGMPSRTMRIAHYQDAQVQWEARR